MYRVQRLQILDKLMILMPGSTRAAAGRVRDFRSHRGRAAHPAAPVLRNGVEHHGHDRNCMTTSVQLRVFFFLLAFLWQARLISLRSFLADL